MMIYLIIILMIIFAFVFYVKLSEVNERRLRLSRIRAAWGIPKNERSSFYLIKQYDRLIQTQSYHRITDQTISDTDLEAVFLFIDRTTSRIGQQCLYHKIINPVNDLTLLNQLNERVLFYASKNELREAIQQQLINLDSEDAYYIASLLNDQIQRRPKWFWLMQVSLSGLLISLAFSVINIFMIVPAFLFATVNLYFHYWNKANVLQYMKSFPQLGILLNVASRISRMHPSLQNESVERSVLTMQSMIWKSKLLDFGKSAGIRDELAQLVGYLIELIKAFFLIEILAFFSLSKQIENQKSRIAELLKYVGEIDSAISIASLRSGASETCTPTFIVSSKRLKAEGLYHPLIIDCVKNRIDVDGRSVLITGSNMSGKTSFLRSIIINSILGQTIFTCFADEFNAPILRQASSIRIDDSLLEGKSYFFEEVSVMASLLNAAQGDCQNLFVLDEIFKGTNTVERIAAAKATLSYLNQSNNIVFVSTHDVELCSLLDSEYDLYHFSENVVDGELIFDHILKHGALTTRNAIKWLEVSGYPMSIVEEARDLSYVLERLNIQSKH